MITETVTSTANPIARRLRALADPRTRRSENAFSVEGAVMIREALQSGLKPIEALSETESALTAELASRGAAVKLCSRHVIESVCDTKTPQGICAAFRLPDISSLPCDALRLLALDGIQDPGNLGTILRTADAAGFEGALLSFPCADVFSPKVQRASMGSGFRVPTLRTHLPDALTEFKSRGYTIIVSTLDGLPIYEQTCLARSPKIILVIGNEANGITSEVRALADTSVKLPMRGKAESLNAAVAAGILMYELTRPDASQSSSTPGEINAV